MEVALTMATLNRNLANDFKRISSLASASISINKNKHTLIEYFQSILRNLQTLQKRQFKGPSDIMKCKKKY